MSATYFHMVKKVPRWQWKKILIRTSQILENLTAAAQLQNV